jgi:hypothetical protein
MPAQRIKCPMGARTAEGALIYDENVSGKRLGANRLAQTAWRKPLGARPLGLAGRGMSGPRKAPLSGGRNDSQKTKANLSPLTGPGSR